MTLFDSRSKTVLLFHKSAHADGLIHKMNPAKAAEINTFAGDYKDSQAPAEALRDYHLKMAPLQLVFDQTRTLEKMAISLLDAWTLGADNVAAVQAESGAWLLGEDPADDLARLEKFHAVFVKFFGTEGLPPALKAAELKKHLAAHNKAAGEAPKMPPAQMRSNLQASQRDLAAAAKSAFEAMHDFLDGYFGKDGDKAFEQKSAYGYDRRAGRYNRANSAAAGGEGTGGDGGGGTGSGAGTGEQQSAPTAKAG